MNRPVPPLGTEPLLDDEDDDDDDDVAPLEEELEDEELEDEELEDEELEDEELDPPEDELEDDDEDVEDPDEEELLLPPPASGQRHQCLNLHGGFLCHSDIASESASGSESGGALHAIAATSAPSGNAAGTIILRMLVLLIRTADR